MRAVYRDMLELHEPLLEVEGRHASVAELGLVHEAGYIERVRGWAAEAHHAEEVTEPAERVRISGASWDAARAAVGCGLTGIDSVLDRAVGNAFCATRPPGRDAGVDRPGGFGLFNAAAIAVRYLTLIRTVRPVLLVEWGGCGPTATREILAGSEDVAIAGVYEGAKGGQGAFLEPGSSGEEFLAALSRELDRASNGVRPAFVVLSADFSGLAADPLGRLELRPADYHPATVLVRDLADSLCEGRLVSILEGGYDADSLGDAAVEHIRALAGLPPRHP